MLKIFKRVMAFSTNKLVAPNMETTQPQSTTIPASNELTIPELEFLLNVLKNADLKGHQIEMFYGLVIKIQDQYIKKTK